MKILNKIRQQIEKPHILKQKADKMAQTERFLFSHRQSYRAHAPIGFKSRGDSSYYLAARTR